MPATVFPKVTEAPITHSTWSNKSSWSMELGVFSILVKYIATKDLVLQPYGNGDSTGCHRMGHWGTPKFRDQATEIAHQILSMSYQVEKIEAIRVPCLWLLPSFPISLTERSMVSMATKMKYYKQSRQRKFLCNFDSFFKSLSTIQWITFASRGPFLKQKKPSYASCPKEQPVTSEGFF